MISIIAAVADNNVIGGENRLLWHISEDLRYFKKVTIGRPVIMGRKTYESIGKPLPGRKNIVITSHDIPQNDNLTTASSLEDAIAKARSLAGPGEEIFIIGGGKVYQDAINFADKIYITRVYDEFSGDTYFPELEDDIWRKISGEYHERGENFENPFEFVVYQRIVPERDI